MNQFGLALLLAAALLFGCGGSDAPAPSDEAPSLQPVKVVKAASPVNGNVLANYGFESGATGWTETSTAGYSLISAYTQRSANTGAQYAWLGSYDNGTDTLSQDVLVPASAAQAKLQFWYQITTNETSTSTAYDTLAVEVYSVTTGQKLATLATLSNLDKSTGWVQSPQYDLTALMGQRVKLKFTATMDLSSSSSFLIDDVAISPLSPAAVTPQNGWWWNPAEGGRGFAIERQGSQIFLAAFLYEAGGAATWSVSTMTQQSNGSFTGTMTRYTGGQTLLGAYKAPAGTTTLANATLTFGGATSGSLGVVPTDGSAARVIAIERFPISTPTAFAASNGAFETGWWWSESQGGRGFFVEVQGSQAFIGSFMYDSAGQPVWYVNTATLQGGQTLSGTLQQYINGQTLTGSYKAPTTVSGSPGTLAFTFPTATSASMLLPNGAAVPITRFNFNTNAASAPLPTPVPTPTYKVAYDTCFVGTPALYTATYCAAYANTIVAGGTPVAANQAGATAAGSNVGNVGTGEVISSTGTPPVGGVPVTCIYPQTLQGGVCVAPVSTPTQAAAFVYLAEHTSRVRFGITGNGDLWAWGDSSSGSLGTGTVGGSASSPTIIGNGFASVTGASGSYSSVFGIKSDNTLWGWGLNTSGELGDGTQTNRLAPTLLGSGFVAVAPAYGCSYAIKSDQTLWAWGRSCGYNYEQILNRRQIGTGFVSAAASSYGVLAIKADGSLWIWGNNDSRWHSAGTTQYTSKFSTLTQIGTGFKSAAITGTDATIALKTDGTLWAWGQQYWGSLGNGVVTGYNGIPQQIGSGYSAISAGHTHVIALKTNGSLWAWGHLSINASNTAADSTTPKQIGTSFVKIFAGTWHDYAIASDGGLWAWGDDFDYGFTTTPTPYGATPVKIK